MKRALLFAWLISLIGFVLSVYFREILDIEPCVLCWFQRMALFPIVVILGMALYRGDSKVVIYLFPFACLGFLVAFYQVLGTYFPILFHLGACEKGLACSKPVFKLFGFLSFPLLSASGFALIFILLYLGKRAHRI